MERREKMNLWLRLLWVLIAVLWRPRIGVTDSSVLGFRVMPHDLDLNIHMTNARYLALMDLGRIDLAARCGLLRLTFQRKWQPVVGGTVVRFRRALKPFQRFSLTSRLVGWDDRWFYFEQSFEAGGMPACLALVRGAFLNDGAIVSPHEVMAEAGHAGDMPPSPAWVGQWRSLDDAFNEGPALRVLAG